MPCVIPRSTTRPPFDYSAANMPMQESNAPLAKSPMRLLGSTGPSLVVRNESIPEVARKLMSCPAFKDFWPKLETRAKIKLGLIPKQSSGERHSLSKVPGLQGSTNTSEILIKSLSICWSSEFLRSSMMLFFFLLRMVSWVSIIPLCGRLMRMTSAPRSASIMARNTVGASPSNSITRTPCKGSMQSQDQLQSMNYIEQEDESESYPDLQPPLEKSAGDRTNVNLEQIQLTLSEFTEKCIYLRKITWRMQVYCLLQLILTLTQILLSKRSIYIAIAFVQYSYSFYFYRRLADLYSTEIQAVESHNDNQIHKICQYTRLIIQYQDFEYLSLWDDFTMRVRNPYKLNMLLTLIAIFFANLAMLAQWDMNLWYMVCQVFISWVVGFIVVIISLMIVLMLPVIYCVLVINRKYKRYQRQKRVVELLNKKETYQDDKNESCIICLEDIVQNETVLELRCSHIFHFDCLHRWLDENDSCPTCRSRDL